MTPALHVVYRCRAGDSPDKERPSWFSKRLCLASLLVAVDAFDEPVDLTYLVDGPVPLELAALIGRGGEVRHLKGGGMARSYQTAIELALHAGWADDEGQFALHGWSADGRVEGGPCAVNCSNRNEIYALHPGGANIGLGDGSVRFLKAGINIATVAALVTRANGEVIGNDF